MFCLTYWVGGCRMVLSNKERTAQRKERNVMSNYVNTTIQTSEAEVNYIVEIHKDMRDNCKHWYTNSYDFSNGDRVKITVEKTKNRATAVTVAESEE